MIDWLTLRLPESAISEADLLVLKDGTGRILFIDADGEIEREVSQWESIKSDSHALNVRLTGERLEIMGSPARLFYGHNVFGSDNIRQCAAFMIMHINRCMGLNLSLDLNRWDCGRIDITHNYDLGSAAEVRQALDSLRHTHGGKQKVNTYQSTVMWAAGSQWRSGKAYHKGPEIRRRERSQARKSGKTEVDANELELCDRLLRLELTVRRKFLLRNDLVWSNLTPDNLNQLHQSYFEQFIGNSLEVADMDTSLIDRCEKSAISPAVGLSAFRTFQLIKVVGLEEAKASMSRSTFYKHRRVLLDAGVTPSELRCTGSNVVPIRRKSIELGQPVTSFEMMRSA